MNAVKQGNSVLESYACNHRGERVLRTPAGGAAQITLYDEAGQWLGNYSATGQAQQQAIWLDNYPVALISVPGTGVPELAYVQPDHLGTPRVVIDPVRDVTMWEWSNKSEVFGNQIPSADPDGDGVAFELALRFAGQQATDASGLFYNYQREYDPAVGRYSQSDPLGLSAGMTTYAYVSSGPLGAADPFGLCEDDHVYRIDRFSLCSPQSAFRAARVVSAPGAPPAREGFTPDVELVGNGGRNHITQWVDSKNMTIVNSTRPGHQFHPGTVSWKVAPGPLGIGSQITIVGEGSGPNPILNDALGFLIFGPAATLAATLCIVGPR
jgi:RHS repeat-associated protein